MDQPTGLESHFAAVVFICYYLVCWDQVYQFSAILLSWVPRGEETQNQMGLSCGQEKTLFGLKVCWPATFLCTDPLCAKK
jgi:hypothetical protein